MSVHFLSLFRPSSLSLTLLTCYLLFSNTKVLGTGRQFCLPESIHTPGWVLQRGWVKKGGEGVGKNNSTPPSKVFAHAFSQSALLFLMRTRPPRWLCSLSLPLTQSISHPRSRSCWRGGLVSEFPSSLVSVFVCLCMYVRLRFFAFGAFNNHSHFPVLLAVLDGRGKKNPF